MRTALLPLLLVVAGCANPARNVYEGAQNRARSDVPPSEAAARPGVTYDDYEKERGRLRNEAR